MKKIIASVLAVVVVVMLLVSLVQIQNLQRRVSSLQATITGLEDNIDRRMLGISERLDAQMNELRDEEQNVFHSVDFSYGEIHMDRSTVEVEITAVPKAYSEEASEVFATVNGQEVPLTLQNGMFQAVTELKLFGESMISDIRVKNGGAVEVQQLDRVMYPQYSVLVQADLVPTGSEEADRKDGKLLWTTDSVLGLHAYSERPFRIQSMVLVEELNGTETGRIPADLSPEAQREYEEHLHRAGPGEAVAVPEQEAPLEDGVTSAVLFHYVSKTYELAPGDRLIRYLELTDDRGLQYRLFADCCAVDANLHRDSAAESELERQSNERFHAVFDSEGNRMGVN